MDILEKNLMLSVIIPVYMSEKILKHTVDQTLNTLNSIGIKYEILLIDDGSIDNTWQVAKSCAKNFENVKAIKLIKNYGQHTAIYCGISHAKGKYIVTMDDDLQNPPEEIIKLLTKAEEGYDLVFANFEEKKHANYRKFGTRIINLLNKKIFNKSDEIKLTNFRIFTKDVADRLLLYRVYEPYIQGLLLMHATKIANITTKHEARRVGKSNYSLSKIITLVCRLLFNYSSYPLKFLSISGGIIALVSFIWGFVIILKQLFIGSQVEGWTTLVTLLAFLNGFIILLLGVLGEYLIRLIKTVSRNEPYHVEELVT